MSNRFKDINIKNYAYGFFDGIINIKNFDPNNIKIHILIYYTGCVTIKDSKYITTNSANPLYLIFSKVNRYFEKIDKNMYLALVPSNESKEIIQKYGEMWSKIRDLIRSITKNSDDYDEKYMKITFDLDDELPLNKATEIHNLTIAFRAVFHENNRYYLQFFLDECLYEL